MVKREKHLIGMGETYYPGDLFDKSWYCTRHGCYPRRKIDDKCAVCAREEEEAARIESLWSSLAKDLWVRARRRWKKDHFEFKISEEWTLKVEDVAKVIPPDRMCPILGIPLLIAGGLEPVFQRTEPYPIWSWRLRRWGWDNSPALDKIIPHKGYVVGNIAVISVLANRIKNSTTDPEALRKIANWLEDRLKEQHWLHTQNGKSGMSPTFSAKCRPVPVTPAHFADK